MVAPQSPFPNLDELVKASNKNKRFRSSIRTIIEVLYESYKKGHQSYDKQKAYIAISRELPFLDKTVVEIFNDLTNRNRSTLDSTTKDVSTISEVSTP